MEWKSFQHLASASHGVSMASCTFIAEGSCESRQAVTQASDVVAGATAVHALGAGLAAAVSIEPRRADWNQRGQAVTAAVLPSATLQDICSWLGTGFAFQPWWSLFVHLNDLHSQNKICSLSSRIWCILVHHDFVDIPLHVKPP